MGPRAAAAFSKQKPREVPSLARSCSKPKKDRATNPPPEKSGGEGLLVSSEQQQRCQFKPDSATVRAVGCDEHSKLGSAPSADTANPRRPRLTTPVVNIPSYYIWWIVIAGLFPLAYAAVLTCLLLQAFRMMRPSSASKASGPSDRTGLKTTHPELLDENGVLTDEELWAVRFSDKDGIVIPEI